MYKELFTMKKVGSLMSIYMAVALSFCMSLTGNLSSGHFTVPAFLISFAVSFVISLIIGLIVPMKPLTDKLSAKAGLKEGGNKRRLFDALVGDIVYTPIMTLIMVTMAYKQAAAHGGKTPPYGIMLGKSMILCLVVGYVIIFIVTPVFMKLSMKQAGIQPHAGGRPPQSDNE